jgi:hypothetical protein
MRNSTRRDRTALRRRSSLLSLGGAAAALMLLAPGIARADTAAPTYQSTVLLVSGDRVGDLQIPANDDLFVDGLTDAGQIVFSAGTSAGTHPELLMQYAHNRITPIVAPASGPASAWAGDVYWPRDVIIDRPVSVNRRGDVVFSADHTGGDRPWGTFLWDAASQKTIPIALKDMPAADNRVFTMPGGVAPVVNDSNEIALVARVKDPDGSSGYGLFFLGRDGILRSVLLPQQDLPGGPEHNPAATDAFMLPSINDAGEIAFLARPQGSANHNAYSITSYGVMCPVLTVDTEVPGHGKVTGVSSVFVNDRDRSMLVTATTDQTGGSRYGLYRVDDGGVTTIAAPGWKMPGGGTLKTVQYQFIRENRWPIMSVSAPNAAGDVAFLARLEDGSTAAYRAEAHGQISLIFSAETPFRITDVSPPSPLQFVPASRPCLNNRGQVALSVRLSGRSLILLLTPNR